MRRMYWYLVCAAVSIVCTGLIATIVLRAGVLRANDQLIGARLDAAKQFIRDHALTNGDLLYDFDSATSEDINGSDDSALVRKAGVAYTAALLYEHDGDPVMYAVADRYAHFVLSDLDQRSYPTGAYAMLFLTMHILENRDTSLVPEEQQFIITILSRERPDGYFPENNISSVSNPYYTGESLVALSHALDDATSSSDHAKIISAIDRAYTGLQRSPLAPGDTKRIYMWLSQATYRLTMSSAFSSPQKDTFRSTVVEIHDQTMRDILPLDQTMNNCIWGEAAAYDILSSSGPGDLPFLDSITSRSLALQVSSPDAGKNIGGFLAAAGDDSARIDYTQHCVAMLLSYEEVQRTLIVPNLLAGR